MQLEAQLDHFIEFAKKEGCEVFKTELREVRPRRIEIIICGHPSPALVLVESTLSRPFFT